MQDNIGKWVEVTIDNLPKVHTVHEIEGSFESEEVLLFNANKTDGIKWGWLSMTVLRGKKYFHWHVQFVGRAFEIEDFTHWFQPPTIEL